MASSSWPHEEFRDGEVPAIPYYEQLAAPGMRSGMVVPRALLVAGVAPEPMMYADGTGRHVKIRLDRRAVVQGTHYSSGSAAAGDEIITVPLPPNNDPSGRTRYDLIVLRKHRTTVGKIGQVIEDVVVGQPGAGAPEPIQTETGLWDLPGAAAKVVAGATTIAATDITDRGYYVSEGGYSAVATNRPPLGPSGILTDPVTGDILCSDGKGGLRVLWRDSGWLEITEQPGWKLSLSTCRRINAIAYGHLTVQRDGITLPVGAANSRIAILPSGLAPTTPAEVRVPGTAIVPGGSISVLARINLAGQVHLTDWSAPIPNGTFLFFGPFNYPLG